MKRNLHAHLFVAPLLALILGAGALWGCAPLAQPQSTPSKAPETATQAATGDIDIATVFPSWNPESKSLAKLVDFVKEATNKEGENYVEPKDRVATFDMDGTLISEKAPVYIDWCLLMYRLLEDPNYEVPYQYSEELNQIRANADEGIIDEDLDPAKNEMLADTFQGEEPQELYAYIQKFLDKVEAEGFEGMTYGKTYYRPMAEVIDYLRANDFDVYIVSACEREVARAVANYMFGIEPDHVIGTDWGTKATGQTDEANNQYTFALDDKLVYNGEKLEEAAKLNKVIYIERQIGRIPILAFGNSSGDYAMLNYAQSNPNHKGMGLLVLCDDVKREYGDTARADEQQEEANEQGWTTFSMADDWATIYGKGVKKTQLAAGKKAESDSTSDSDSDTKSTSKSKSESDSDSSKSDDEEQDAYYDESETDSELDQAA